MIEEFREAFANRYQVITQESEAHRKKVMGWVCTYVPEEILYAADIIPFRVLGGEGETARADAYLYSNVCSFTRSCLEEGLSNRYHFLEGLVSCSSCDNMRRLYDVWQCYLEIPFMHLIKVPHKITETTINYFRDEVVVFKESLEKYLGREISDQSLQEAIKVYNKTRLLLKELYHLRRADAPPISGAETLDVILAGMVLPRDRYIRLLEDLLKNIDQREKIAGDRVRLLLVGSELDNSEYIKVIEDLGGLVVVDDLCHGTRYFWDLVESDGDPLGALAKRYLTRSPCARMWPATNRLNHIKEMIKDFKVQGVILEVVKFCDLYAQDYPIFRDEVKDMGIPILTLEREYPLAGVGQMKTRIQAFLESLGN